MNCGFWLSLQKSASMIWAILAHGTRRRDDVTTISTTAELTRPENVLPLLDFAGVAVFAATGALAAAREKHDLVTFAFFAAFTGVGGGTLRDLLIGAPVFWVADRKSVV